MPKFWAFLCEELMKLFQQLLVAPAALGLLATGANAAELNINGVSEYAAADQVTSVTQFSDVYPTDWAYQALSNLVETYGCVAGYPSGTFRGNRAMTRYEAAALLNACLDSVTGMTDELKRLIKEFEIELSVIKGRVDGLEARVGELEATQFSTTTKLAGRASWALGATKASGGSSSEGDSYDSQYGATTFSYDLALAFKTSFTGKDLLFSRLRVGNADNALGGKGFNLTGLDYPTNSANVVRVGRLYYRFPLGSDFTVVVGPRMRNQENFGYKASVYTAGGHPQLDLFSARLGAPGVWSKTTGAGFGAIYSNKSNVEKGSPYLTVAANYVAQQGHNSDPNSGGFMTDNAQGSTTTQVAYGSKQWGLSAGYRYSQCGSTFGKATEFARTNGYSQNCVDGDGKRTNADAHSWAINAFWQPEDSGLIPSVSAGVGKSYLNGDFDYNAADKFASWMLGLQWADVFVDGNAFGFAVGQPQFVSSLDSGTPDDGNYAMELWYSFHVTDNIVVAPGIYWLSNPAGDLASGDDSVGVFGGVVQTRFKF